MKGCFGLFVLLITFPLALLSTCANHSGGSGLIVLICGIGLSIYLFVAWKSDLTGTRLASERAQRDLITKADSGDEQSMYECAVRFETASHGFIHSRELAREYYERAANLGHVKAIERRVAFTENPQDPLTRPSRVFRKS